MNFIRNVSAFILVSVCLCTALPVEIPNEIDQPIVEGMAPEEKSISKRQVDITQLFQGGSQFSELFRKVNFNNNNNNAGGRGEGANNNNNNNANLQNGGLGIFFNNNDNFNGGNFVGKTEHFRIASTQVLQSHEIEHKVTTFG